ncbi:MAG: hypothetical protein JRG92_02935 [Deltaproteobacteria bacterium]|nr:hypothetical protein [Deltaproteobacteria bacterium]
MSIRRRPGSALLACGMALASVWAGPAGAAGDLLLASATSCTKSDAPQADVPQGDDELSPPNLSGPTRIGMAFRVLEIRDIDPVQGSYSLRGYVRTSWCDRRLAFDADEQGVDERVYVGPAADARLGKTVWFPSAFPVNQVGELRVTERVLRIRHDGTIEQDMNIVVPLSTHFDLRRFPFDEQTLIMEVESFVFSAEQVVLVDDAARTGFDPSLQLPEWTLHSVVGRVADAPVMRSREPHSRYQLEIRIGRKPGFYLWKVFLPLVIIVALSWSVFWMPEEKFASRSRISATGVLTIVAYQFAFGADLPRVGYLTLLDKTMIASFGLLAVTVLESLLISPWQTTHPDRALRVDQISRLLFPGAYLVMLTLIFGVGS